MPSSLRCIALTESGCQGLCWGEMASWAPSACAAVRGALVRGVRRDGAVQEGGGLLSSAGSSDPVELFCAGC